VSRVMQYGFPQHVKPKAQSAATTELSLAWDVTPYNLVPTSISEKIPSSIFRTADEFSRPSDQAAFRLRRSDCHRTWTRSLSPLGNPLHSIEPNPISKSPVQPRICRNPPTRNFTGD